MRLLLFLLSPALPAAVQAQQGQFTYTTYNGTITITGVNFWNPTLNIPSTINGLPVISIGGYAFSGYPGPVSVTIPNNVTSIGEYAFAESDLTSVTIPNSVTTIGTAAFYECISLTNVIIGDSVTSIGDGAFYGCSLKSAYFEGNAPSLGLATFGNNNATVYYLPGTTGWSNFATITGLPTVMWFPFIYTTNNGAITITEYTGTVGTVTIPSTFNGLPVTSIGSQAFFNCTNLTSITILNSVTTIGSEAFSGCTSLTSVTIGNSVTNIGSEAFSGCTSLTSVTIGNSVTSIGDHAFYNCYGLTSVIIPNSVNSIGTAAFYYCYGLTDFTIPNSVTNIGAYAFYFCSSLTNVMIGNGVTSIGTAAFYNCYGLTSAYFQGNAPSLGVSVFANQLFGYDALTAYYLPGTIGWSGFATNAHIPAMLWLPQVQTSGASFIGQSNQFGFNINWASGQKVVVEACTNLFNSVWQPVQTNTLTSGSSYFSDPQWTVYHGRFYRLRSP